MTRWETRGTYDGGKRTETRPPSNGPGQGAIVPIGTSDTPKPVYSGRRPGAFRRPSRPELLRPDPVKALSDVPDATKEPPGRPSPGRLSASEIERIAEIGLKALVGSTDVPALVIPTGNGAVAETRFNLAKLRKYKAVRYDDNRIFFTEKHADLDRGKNELATDWVQNYSDAAKIQTLICPARRCFADPSTSWPSTR